MHNQHLNLFKTHKETRKLAFTNFSTGELLTQMRLMSRVIFWNCSSHDENCWNLNDYTRNLEAHCVPSEILLRLNFFLRIHLDFFRKMRKLYYLCNLVRSHTRQRKAGRTTIPTRFLHDPNPQYTLRLKDFVYFSFLWWNIETYPHTRTLSFILGLCKSLCCRWNVSFNRVSLSCDSQNHSERMNLFFQEKVSVCSVDVLLFWNWLPFLWS